MSEDKPNPYRVRTKCPECGGVVPIAKKRARVFCCDAHKNNHANRMAARGKSLAKVSMGWRITRGSGANGKLLFSEMTSMLDAWNAEDREAGRMRAEEYAMLTLNAFASTAYQDRRISRIVCVEHGSNCDGMSKSSGGTNMKIAARMATDKGWKTFSDGSGVCPACIKEGK